MTRPTPQSTASDAAAHLDDAIDAILDERPVLLDPGQRALMDLLPTARLLHEALPRFHPRFGFEERLAGRLRSRGPDVVAFPLTTEGAPVPTGSLRRRGLVAGGAIASGLSLALPLAGAAVVAWRRSRSTGGI